MFKVGVTGGIGSGKTTVTNIFGELGIEVVDADLVAREVVQPGTQALAKIRERYGPKILLNDGGLNRPQLRKVVFSTPEEKTWLEELLHPLIFRLSRERLNSAHSAYAILSSPLLIESGEYQIVDRVLVVDIPEALQKSRTAARDNTTPEHIQQIIENQISREKRLQYADDILDNSLDELQLRLAVEQLHLKYLEYAREHA
jgi:dephospho-CoA kinase